VQRAGAPIVIKADGLAAARAVVAATPAEAEAAIDLMFGGTLGEAGTAVVIEEFLTGEEASFFVCATATMWSRWRPRRITSAVHDGDTGPNTGGMGAYSPASVMTPALEQRALDEIVLPTIRALKAMGTPYKGVLFAGLMITAAGPKLIGYNVRFGDPECQVLMLRLMSDLLPALMAARDGMLKNFALRWYPEAALTVVMAAKGIPAATARVPRSPGSAMRQKSKASKSSTPGTASDGGRILANGGACSIVGALGETVAQAQARAYAQWTASCGRRGSAAATSGSAR